MRPFLLFALVFPLSAPSISQDVSGWLANLPKTRDYVQKRASSYDRSGGNLHLRRLGAGETLALLEDSGPGIITHIWITLTNDEPNELKALVLRMYWEWRVLPECRGAAGGLLRPRLGRILPLPLDPPGGRT